MEKPGKRTIAVDFDGVIHSYESPRVAAHVIPDPPVSGAIPWLLRMLHRFRVVIFSTRCRTWRGRRAMRAWLKKWGGETCFYDGPAGPGLESIEFSKDKPPSLILIDDRAYRFTGRNFPTAEEIHELRPWNRPRR